ncbi:MAG TPA: SLC13 family permease, partial [Candidatus Sulfotelmatobacter sp.]|nr:SLC13 family permease [Candidatus Sulfotelmatobacter sp.]
MRHNPTRLQEPVTATQTPRTLEKKSRRSTFARGVAPIIVGVAIGLTPTPHGLPLNAWRYFALFAAVMVGIITEPIPPAALGLVGVIVAAAAGLVRTSTAQATAWALSGFGNATVWLIFAAFIFSLGYAKTGFGKRIALLLIRTMGRRTLGLGYAIALGDLALAPFMPSNTARSG